MNTKSKSPNLKIPFTKWLVDNGYSTPSFIKAAHKRGLPLAMSTVHKWRIGIKPRPCLLEMVEAKFKGLTF